MGQQGAHVCDVIFEDCRVAAGQMLGGSAMLHKGFQTAMKTLDRGRIHISALSVGCAERLIELCLAMVKNAPSLANPSLNFSCYKG